MNTNTDCANFPAGRKIGIIGILLHWAHMGPYGPIWANMGPHWVHMGPAGPIWAHIGPI